MAKILDFIYRDEGEIILLDPLTKPAKRWMKENLIIDGYQKTPEGIAIDRRIFEDILEGITGAGFIIENMDRV